EPVDLGSTAGFTIAAATAANVNSQGSFGVAAEYGGYVTGAAGLTVTGYLSSTAGALTLGVRNDSPAPDDDTLVAQQVNGLYRAAPNAYGTHGLFISIAGWSFGTNPVLFWPGHLSAATAPGGTLASLDNQYIIDAAGNRLEPTSDTVARPITGTTPAANYGTGYAASTVALTGAGWDTTKPAIANPLAPLYDVVPLASVFNIDRIEMDYLESMRDSSLTYPTNSAVQVDIADPAFLFRSDTQTVGDYRYAGSDFSTEIISSYLRQKVGLPPSVNVKDDRFLSILMKPIEELPAWNAQSQMRFSYTQSKGLLTDLAGNLVNDYASDDKLCIEKLPPKVRFTSAVEGASTLYLQFTEPVLHLDGSGIDPVDLVFTGGFSATAIRVVKTVPFGIYSPLLEAFIDLNQPLTTQFMLSGNLTLSNLVLDRASNPADPLVLHQPADIALGVVNVLAATDGIHEGDPAADPASSIPATGLGALRVFDGTGKLYDRDITLFSGLDLTGAPAPTGLPLQLYYDVDPAASVLPVLDVTGRSSALSFWTPSLMSGLVDKANEAARTLSPIFSGLAPSTARNFLFPAADPEITSGKEIGFMFKYGNLILGRAADPADPRSFDLYRFSVQDIRQQRGSVTILNNVINPNLGERMALQVKLAEAGVVTIQIFTLDGDLVKVLYRDRLAAGTFTFTWDGRNNSGDAVARGIYFVRTVASGIDEIRKVLIAK
ncbi:MAG: hypothetical protein JNG85_01875, partial [Spirochaetaceae bacterium]|nr:hypothetical protein [Spirochaetaceae bacterium]